jgi:hypothetical protein
MSGDKLLPRPWLIGFVIQIGHVMNDWTLPSYLGQSELCLEEFGRITPPRTFRFA